MGCIRMCTRRFQVSPSQKAKFRELQADLNSVPKPSTLPNKQKRADRVIASIKAILREHEEQNEETAGEAFEEDSRIEPLLQMFVELVGLLVEADQPSMIRNSEVVRRKNESRETTASQAEGGLQVTALTPPDSRSQTPSDEDVLKNDVNRGEPSNRMGAVRGARGGPN